MLPARGIDRCEVTDKPLTVVFKLNADHFSPLPGAADSTAVMGSEAPLSWTSRDAQSLLRNDGIGYDAVAGDVFYTRAITFPDSTRFQVNFKYWNNGLLECAQIPERTFTLDYVNYRSGTQIHAGTTREGMEQPVNVWVPSIAVQNIVIYTGDKFPEWKGSFFVGSLVGERLGRLTLDGKTVKNVESIVQGRGRIRGLRQGPDGFLYLAFEDAAGGPSKLVRLEPVRRS